MSVTIRLSRTGRKHRPSFRVVAANTRDKRDGKPIEILGHYNPSETPVKLELDKEKIEAWRGKGALVSEAVEQLLAGTYEFKPYEGAKAEGKGAAEEKAPGASDEGTEGAENKEEPAETPEPADSDNTSEETPEESK
jgi:small subunit ribosomal protein S16